MVLALVMMRYITSVEQGWRLLIGLGAGTGLVLILRWYWWRINAWSEISAMAASFVTSIALLVTGHGQGDQSTPDFAFTMLTTVGVTTLVWLAVTLLTRPEPEAVLDRFYRQVRPGGGGWAPVSSRLGYGIEPIPGGALSLVNWVAGVVAVYAAVFAVGDLLTGSVATGALAAAVAVAAFLLIQRNLRRDPMLRARVDTPAAGA